MLVVWFPANPTFAFNGHFRRSGRRILFAINSGYAETAQVCACQLGVAHL